MSSCIVSASSVSLAVLLEVASVSGQFVEPSKVLPPSAQKTTVSRNLAPIQPHGPQPQPVEQSKFELRQPTPPAQVSRVTPQATPLTLAESPASDTQSPLAEQFSPWLSTPSTDWFAPVPVKAASFDQPATTNANAWQQKPKASFGTAPPASQTHSWDDPHLKGSKSGWK